jgi:hypothetical protein
MKKLLTAAILLFAFAVSFAEKPIQLRLEKGKTYSQISNINSKVSQFVQGMSVDVEMGITSTYSFKVLDVKDSLIFTEVTLSKIKSTAKSPMGTQEFSSDSPNPSEPTSILFQELTKCPYMLTLTQSGKVVDVNANASLDKALSMVPALSDDQKAMLKSQFSARFGDDIIKQSLESGFAYYPPKNVKGEKWTSTQTVKSNLELEIHSTNEVADVTNESVTIKHVGELTSPETNEPTMINGMSAKPSINGASEGTVTINIKTGWIINSNITQNLKGNIDFMPNAQMPNGMQVPITVTNTVTFTE